MKHIVLSALATAALATAAQAAVLDSNTFSYKYEADAKPGASSPAWTRTGFGANDNLLASVSSGILTINTDPTGEPGTGTQSWNLYTIADPAASWGVQANQPYVVEMRVLVNDAPDNTTAAITKTRSGLKLAIGDGQRQANITIVNTGVRDTNTLNSLSTANNQDGNYHTFQIAVAANHLSYDIYRDGISIGTGIATTAITTADSIFFGDDNNSGSLISNQGRDINVAIDYVRWDAALPVPEPTSMAAIGLGGLMLLRRHRR